MLQKIQDRFTESIQTQIAAADLLPKILNDAANKIVSCLLSGNKVIVCGYARSYINAQLFTSHLLSRYDLARPSLSVQLLQLDSVLHSFLTQEGELDDIYKKQLQVIANTGDILVAFSPIGNEGAVLNAIHYAKNENLSIIAFTSSRNDHTHGLLTETDLEISIPSNNEMRAIEGHQFCINLLSELIDQLLFSPTPHQ